MNRETALDEIFSDDPFGLLNVKPKNSNLKTSEQHLVGSFEEISDFVAENAREPKASQENINEYQLYARLKGLREDTTKTEILKEYDYLKLLPKANTKQEEPPPKAINSLDDIFADDSLNMLGDDDTGLFELKNVPKIDERASTDFVARRKPCQDFDKYEARFKEVHADLREGMRKLIDYSDNQLRKGNYFVHNGILLLLDETFDIKNDKFGKPDGRTRVIFENGTESAMKLRSLGKNLLINGKCVTVNIDKVNENFIKNFGNITDEDEEAGYIYVLKSKSNDEQISTIKDLYKIGYSKIDVQERIKNAEKEPTYLMAPVAIKGAWKCFNMNPQKLEQLLHNFFGSSCLELDVFDDKGKRHTPREWFIAPMGVIEQAVELIISGKIVDYRFDVERMVIVKK